MKPKLRPKKAPEKPKLKPRHPKRYAVLNDELDHLPIATIYPKLIAKLQTDLKRSGEAKLKELIASAPDDSRLAGYIYAVAREDHERIKDEFERLMGGWLVTARKDIAELKKNKEWEGGVAQADVERYIANNEPSYLSAKEVFRKSERQVDAARRLFESYQYRLSSLQSYAKLIQKRQGLSVAQKHER
jgi:hypothetical protein